MKTERPDGPSTSHPAVLPWSPTRSRLATVAGATLFVGVVAVALAMWPTGGTRYPKHTGVVATTFWVGELFNPNASDGSQAVSAYDSNWLASYGGCDGVLRANTCETEVRSADNGYFPRHMTPRENPFYLDLPFDDVNNEAAFRMRGTVIPWAEDPGYKEHLDDRSVSLMKNRWVMIQANGQTCYGQIEDAGPSVYDDAGYVFGDEDRRPENHRYNNAGMDVSPALNGCLHFRNVNGDSDVVDWKFVEFSAVPQGPWRKIVTVSGVR